MAEAVEMRAAAGADRVRRASPRKGNAQKPALRKGERTATAILDAAEALFAERGYVGTTMRTVAKAVGLRDPSLYNHFASKDALYAAVLERTYRPIADEMDGLVSAKSSWTGMGEVISAINELVAGHPTAVRLLQFEILTGRGRLHPVLDRWLRELFGRGYEAAKHLPVRGRIDEEELLLRIIAMHNLVLGYCTAGPLYKRLGGQDLLSQRVRRKQGRVLEIIHHAFERTPPGGTEAA